MSTRSIVAIKNDDGSYDAIYCHYDGYIDGGVGDALQEHHDSPELARALVDAGDHYSIVDGCETYASKGAKWKDVAPQRYDTENALNAAAPNYWAEFLHIFVGGIWTHREV